MTNSSPPAQAEGELLRERDRVVQRLRSMALATIPAERVHAAAQQLADLATDARNGTDAGEAPRRTVPVLAPYAAGDQIAVLVADLALAADQAARPDVLAAATRVLAELRHDLSAPAHP